MFQRSIIRSAQRLARPQIPVAPRFQPIFNTRLRHYSEEVKKEDEPVQDDPIKQELEAKKKEIVEVTVSIVSMGGYS